MGAFAITGLAALLSAAPPSFGEIVPLAATERTSGSISLEPLSAESEALDFRLASLVFETNRSVISLAPLAVGAATTTVRPLAPLEAMDTADGPDEVFYRMMMSCYRRLSLDRETGRPLAPTPENIAVLKRRLEIYLARKRFYGGDN